MHKLRTRFALFTSLVLCPLLALGQPGPGEGPDENLEAIEPSPEPIRIGLAGEYPADIARFLLVQGISSAQLSPNRNYVAVSKSVTGQPQLWLIPTDGGQARQLTFGNGITFFRWAPDGQSLIYGADNAGDEQEAYFRISVDGKTEAEVVPALAGAFRAFGGVLPDNRRIVFASTERNGLDFDIYVRDLETGEQRMLYQGEFAFWPRSISPDGKSLLMTQAVGEDSNNLFLVDIESAKVTTLSQPERRADTADGGFAWSADGKAVFHGSNEGREFRALVRREIASNEVSVIAAPAQDVGNIQLCGQDDRFLLWTTNEDGFFRVHGRDLVENRALQTPTVPSGVYSLSCPAGSPVAALVVDGTTTPGDLLLWDLASGQAETLWAANLAGLDPDRLVAPVSIRMPARDGVMLQGLLYLPRDDARLDDGPPPVVFDVHGGPTAQSVANFNGSIQYLVNRGIAVFRPNIRGSTGFGHTYVTLDDQERRLDSIRDLVDMLAFFREDGRVDASRAIVRGGSYGGYAVNAVLANHPDSFIAGVSLFGVADWVTGLEVASPALKASDIIEYGDIREERWQQFYGTYSPIRQADQIKVPVLYSHGVNDRRVEIYETEVMVRTLRANGIETPYIRFRDEGHGWRQLSNRLFYARREAEFLLQQFGILADAD
ncbi:MAG: prolyl oligopeptidase family serine peptidase [Wenzhouxiangella sp.]|jgi:dipeptidyl aminopeptidase/acylaminoacyl peptidase|nr:prolyl oligopeptidase family serine peptidase [Wenzhouxiangella sp.]